MKGRATEIQTARLCLRAVSDCDRDNLIALLTNHEVRKTFMVPELKTTSKQMQMFEVLKEMSHWSGVRKTVNPPCEKFHREDFLCWCGTKPHITHYTQTVYRSALLYSFDKLEFT